MHHLFCQIELIEPSEQQKAQLRESSIDSIGYVSKLKDQ